MPKYKIINTGITPQDRRRKTAIFALLISGILILGGITLSFYYKQQVQQNSQAPIPAPSAASSEATSTPTAEPTQLSIPSLNINAPFTKLGLNEDHTLEVPKGDSEVGWFVYGAKPGDIGPSVIVGHLDSVRGRAVFANLDHIKPGDTITISRADHSIVRFIVDSIATYSQNNFPTQDVYGSIPYPGLRLITCAGTYNTAAKHYSDNLVVFASLSSQN